MRHFDLRNEDRPGEDGVLAAVETAAAGVFLAKRAADESLARVNAAPEPHMTTNTVFVALYEAHQRDREALFAAMRRLDTATEALRKIRTPGAAPQRR